MTTKDTGGPAFPFSFEGPTTAPEFYEGMTLRDYFAAKAMAAHAVAVSGVATKTPQDWHEMVAQMAYMTADAMLAERNKQ